MNVVGVRCIFTAVVLRATIRCVSKFYCGKVNVTHPSPLQLFDKLVPDNKITPELHEAALK